MIHSPSGDIDILVLFLLHFQNNIFVDNSSGQARKILKIASFTLATDLKQALSGIHAFSGNDYVSIFFRKGKQQYWRTLLKYPQFVETFKKLGLFNSLPEEDQKHLEKFVCTKESSVNEVRKLTFMRKFQQEKKVIDLHLLPPCAEN